MVVGGDVNITPTTLSDRKTFEVEQVDVTSTDHCKVNNKDLQM